MAGPALMSTSGARRVGMSVKQRPRPLLSQIGGRPVERLESVDTSDSEFPRKMSSDVKSQEYDPFTAPPESSDEEDNNKPPVKGFKGFSSDSDDDGPPPGDIQPTKFGKRNQQPSFQTSNAPGRTRRITTTKAYSTARSSQTEAPSSSAGSKRSGEESGLAKSGSHLEDGFGFCKKPKTTKRTQIHAPGRRQTKQFGGKSSQNSIPRSSAPQRDAPRRAFKNFEPSESPERNLDPPKRGFRLPSSVDSTPNATPRKVQHRQHSHTPDLSPKKGTIKLFDSDGPDFGSEFGSPKVSGASEQRRSTKSKARGRDSSPADDLGPSTQRPVFRLPSDDLDDIGGPINYDNKAGPEEALNDDEEEDVTEILASEGPSREARCPMCHETVDRELLEKHSDRGRMSIRKQTTFCRLHKRRTAASSGSARGYPTTIDWEGMEGRLAGHEAFLREVLEGQRASHYASVLRRKVESGRERTLLKAEDSVTPGYYGPRGLRVMTDFVVRRLARPLRRRAVEDRLVAARGYTAYVQAVLVPELAARLVMEDMGVSEPEARDVLRDSIEVGELLNEDIGDVVATADADAAIADVSDASDTEDV